jgi:hypothetical protein
MNFGKYLIVCLLSLKPPNQFLYARSKWDVLWYGDVRPVLCPSIRPSIIFMIMTVSVHFLSDGQVDSNDIWYTDVL